MIIAGCTVVIAVLGLCLTGLPLHVRRRDLGVARRARRDARRGHAAAGAALLPRAERVDRLRLPLLGRGCKRDGRTRESLGARAGATPSSAGPWTAAIVGDGGAARARRARARHAARLPRRRQRPAGHDDPPGLRPEHRGLRARHQRAARDRRRAARRRRPSRRSTRFAAAAAQRAAASPSSPRRAINDARRRRDDHRDPDDLAAGQGDRGPRQPAARRRRARRARRHRHHRRDRRRDRGARGPERVHEGPHAAVHRRRRRPLVPAAAGRLPLAADLAQGGDHEPALGRAPPTA